MNLEEYNQVKDFSYDNYCDYLKKKYGEVPEPYYVPKKSRGRKKADVKSQKKAMDDAPFYSDNVQYIKNRKIGRGNDGLMVHHTKEDRIPRLSASPYPLEYQEPRYLVYCDYLEHLLLHIMIQEIHKDIPGFGGGIYAWLIPEIDNIYNESPDLYSWHWHARDVIKDDKDVYELLKKRYENDLEKAKKIAMQKSDIHK